MSIIYGFLVLVEAIVCALLVGVILLQKSKGGMGGAAFGGGMGEAIFGSRMGNVLTKTTVILGGVFLFNTLLLTVLTARRGGSGASVTDSGLIEQSAPAPVAQQPVAQPMGTPNADGGAAPIELPKVDASAADATPIEIPAEKAPEAAPAPEAPAAPAAPAPAAPEAPVAPEQPEK